MRLSVWVMAWYSCSSRSGPELVEVAEDLAAELVDAAAERLEAAVERVEAPVYRIETPVDGLEALTEERDELLVLGRRHGSTSTLLAWKLQVCRIEDRWP